MKFTSFTIFSVLSYVSSEQFSENLHLEKDLKVEGKTELQGSISLEGPVHITGKVQFGDSSVDAICLLYTSPSPRDQRGSRMPSSA